MAFKEERKKHILNEFLKTISNISNIEYQRRVWIRGEGPECDDFDETVCYFSSIRDLIFENYKKFDISEHQYNLLLIFFKEFDEFSDKNNYEPEFIDSTEWKHIMEMAKGILIAFNYSQ